MIEKNPFSLYDFLGYFIPGAFCIYLFYIFWDINPSNQLAIITKVVSLNEFDSNWTLAVFLALISYIGGHFIAYISSITIEKFSVWVYGYPSSFLLAETEKYHFLGYKNNRDQQNEFWRIIYIFFCRSRHDVYFELKYFAFYWRVIITIILLPIAIQTIVLSKFLRVKFFFVKTLDSFLVDIVNARLGTLLTKLALNSSMSDESGVDYHRLIYHYIYEQQKGHRPKLDNYVALYGFLRSMTFIFNLLAIHILLYSICNYSFTIKTLIYFIISSSISYVFFMAFMKFYRRYTLESFMCLVTDSHLSETIQNNNNQI